MLERDLGEGGGEELHDERVATIMGTTSKIPLRVKKLSWSFFFFFFLNIHSS